MAICSIMLTALRCPPWFPIQRDGRGQLQCRATDAPKHVYPQANRFGKSALFGASMYNEKEAVSGESVTPDSSSFAPILGGNNGGFEYDVTRRCGAGWIAVGLTVPPNHLSITYSYAHTHRDSLRFCLGWRRRRCGGSSTRGQTRTNWIAWGGPHSTSPASTETMMLSSAWWKQVNNRRCILQGVKQ